MSKLYLVLFYLHLYFFSTSQSLQIEKLKGSVNTIKNSELNFRYINDSTAIYTELNNEKSNLFYAVKKADEWFKSKNCFFQTKKLQTFVLKIIIKDILVFVKMLNHVDFIFENITNVRKFKLLPKA